MLEEYSWNNVASAFTTVAKKIDKGEPIFISKLNFSPKFEIAFKQAVTHSFKKEKHGFDLCRIFIIDERGNWQRNTIANTNPQDARLIDLIIKAMNYVSK